jgi:hypothetical protein
MGKGSREDTSHGHLVRPQGSRRSVLVNRSILEGLFGLPIFAASRMLGMRPTSFKKACRRCGIERWPYDGTRSGKRPPGCTEQLESDFDQWVPAETAQEEAHPHSATRTPSVSSKNRPPDEYEDGSFANILTRIASHPSGDMGVTTPGPDSSPVDRNVDRNGNADLTASQPEDGVIGAIMDSLESRPVDINFIKEFVGLGQTVSVQVRGECADVVR